MVELNSQIKILGAYAAHPPVPEFFGSDDESSFYQTLAEWSEVNGLELPFTSTLHPNGIAHLAQLIPQNYALVITPLPGLMQTLARDPEFGLASRTEAGRLRALESYLKLERETQELLALRPDLRLIGVECQSGPREPSADSFAFSLEQLLTRDFFRDRLLMEHCDPWRRDGRFSKGFLDFESELTLAKKLKIPVIVNWGRSVIDTQSVSGPVTQIETLARAEVWAGVVFSGASLGHALYGDTFEDSHAPLASAWGAGDPTRLAMTDERVRECQKLANYYGAWQGIKVQPLPKTMELAERLEFLRAHTLQIFQNK